MSELKEIREIILVNIKDVVRENKEKVEDAYKRVMKMAHLAHREGLLALDYEAEFIPKETPLCNEIAEMAELIAGGTEPKIFEELMTIKFFAVHNSRPSEKCCCRSQGIQKVSLESFVVWWSYFVNT